MTKKTELMLTIAVGVLLVVSLFYVHKMSQRIERPGVDCPKCGSWETLVVSKDDGETDCLCAECKTHFQIYDEDVCGITEEDANAIAVYLDSLEAANDTIDTEDLPVSR